MLQQELRPKRHNIKLQSISDTCILNRGVPIIGSADISATYQYSHFWYIGNQYNHYLLADINTDDSACEIYFIQCMPRKRCYHFFLNEFGILTTAILALM